MEILELESHLKKETKYYIYKKYIDAEVKDVYDFLIYKKYHVIAIISDNPEKYNFHFQDVPILRDLLEFKNTSCACVINLESEYLDGIQNIFVHHEIIILNNFSDKTYSDDNGNLIENNSDCEVNIVLYGSNNHLTIGKSTISDSVRFELHENSRLDIEDYCNIQDNCKIIVYCDSQVSIGSHVKFGNEVEVSCRYFSKVDIGTECIFRNCSMIFNKYGSVIEIGVGSTFEQRTNIISIDKSFVKIGSGFMGSFDLAIISNDGHGIYDYLSGEKLNKSESTLIGNDVWSGIKSTIMGGSHIPDGCIIGANTVVTRNSSYEERSIIVGTPPRCIRKNIEWRRYL